MSHSYPSDISREQFALAGKVPPALEELRKKAQYQPANGGARFRGTDSQKIVDRFLDKHADRLCPSPNL